ncbi:MAG: ABC transporter permease, partial [Pseudomonadota bacterium]
MIPFLIYTAIFIASFIIVREVSKRVAIRDFTSLKTVTFGDESAVRSNRTA